MLKRDWRLYAATLGALGLVVAVIMAASFVWSHYELGRKAHQEYRSRSYTSQQQAADHIAAKCNSPSAPAGFVQECLSAEIRAYQDQDTTNQDLQAQQEMAFWAFWMFSASVAGLVVSIAGLGLLLMSLMQTRTAIRDTREIGEAQVRAYLTVTGGDFIVRSDGTIEFRVQMRNVGTSPSPECEVFAQASSPRITESEISAALDYSDTVSLRTFFIPTGETWSRWITIKTPFPALASQYLYEGWSPVKIEGQIRWKDVFGGQQMAEFLMLEHLDNEPKFNSDNPPSRHGSLRTYTQRPSGNS